MANHHALAEAKRYLWLHGVVPQDHVDPVELLCNLVAHVEWLTRLDKKKPSIPVNVIIDHDR